PDRRADPRAKLGRTGAVPLRAPEPHARWLFFRCGPGWRPAKPRKVAHDPTPLRRVRGDMAHHLGVRLAAHPRADAEHGPGRRGGHRLLAVVADVRTGPLPLPGIGGVAPGGDAEAAVAEGRHALEQRHHGSRDLLR